MCGTTASRPGLTHRDLMTGASYLGPHADKLLGFDVPQLHDHAVADVGPRSVRDHELVRFYFLQCSEASVACSQGARSRLHVLTRGAHMAGLL